MTALPAFLGPLVSGLAGALTVRGLGRLAVRSGGAERRGWRQLRPGPMHWAGLVLSGGLVAFMGWIGLFVGSSRADAAFQMRVLWVLVALFAAGGAAILWQVRAIGRAGIAWRGRKVAFAGPDGAPVVRAMDEVSAVRPSLLGAVRVVFADGAVLRIDPHASGAADLLERIAGDSSGADEADPA